MWKTEEHSKNENRIYIEGRSGEWANLPVYATEILVPPLMLVLKWYFIIPLVFLSNILWGMVSDKVINPKISYLLFQINRYRWVVFLIFGIFYFSKEMYIEGALSFAWPFISVVFALLNFTSKYTRIKENFEKILYNKEQSKNEN